MIPGTPRSVFIFICLTLLPVLASEQAVDRRPNSAEGNSLPPDLAQQVKLDLGVDDEVRNCYERLGFGFKEIIRTSRLKLNPKLGDCLLVEGLDCLSGASNGPKLIYAKTADGWRKVFDETGQRVRERKARSRGWLDLELWQHDSAYASIRYLFRFDGTRYRAVKCNVVDFSDPATARPLRTPHYKVCEWDWQHEENQFLGPRRIVPKGSDLR